MTWYNQWYESWGCVWTWGSIPPKLQRENWESDDKALSKPTLIYVNMMSYQWMRNPGTPKSVKYWSCALGKSMYLKRSYRFLSSQPSFPERVLALETLQGEARTFSEPFSEPIGHDRTYPSCFWKRALILLRRTSRNPSSHKFCIQDWHCPCVPAHHNPAANMQVQLLKANDVSPSIRDLALIWFQHGTLPSAKPVILAGCKSTKHIQKMVFGWGWSSQV
jgi:hypothetical protein